MKRIALVLMLLSATAAEAQIKTITGGGYQNSNGVACAGCILYLQLPVDATVTGTGQIVPNLNQYTLDANGNVPANSNLWGNDQLTPSGLTYKATLTNAGGGRIWGPEFLSISGTSPISLTQLVPVASSSVFFNNPVILNTSNVGSLSVTSIATTGAFPTCAATGTGTGATCGVFQSNSDDNSGAFTISTGTGPTSTGSITLTFNNSTGNFKYCVFLPANTGLANWNARASFIITAVGGTNDQAAWDNNAVNLTGSTTYVVQYICGRH